MSSLPAQRRARSLFPEFSELFAGFPALTGLRPAFDTRVMRLEDEMKDGRYVVRAEMPGVDPAKDIDITVRDGQLTIKAERSEKKDFDGRSEFSYGSFIRTVSLPPGADEDSIEATYDQGILTVSVAISEPKPAEPQVRALRTPTGAVTYDANHWDETIGVHASSLRKTPATFLIRPSGIDGGGQRFSVTQPAENTGPALCDRIAMPDAEDLRVPRI